MDRRVRKTTAPRRPAGAKHRVKNRGRVVQFLLLMSVGVLLIGSLVAWKVFAQRSGWHEWSMGVRNGLIGMHGNRPTDSAEEGDEFGDKSIRYHGGGYADLGRFSIGRYNSITNTTLTVNFQLKGMTPYETKTSFNEFMRQNERAFRDRVTEAVRDCRESDYADTKSMTNKVVTRVNRAFNGRLLESAELDDFQVYESVGTYQAQDWETAEEAAASNHEEGNR